MIRKQYFYEFTTEALKSFLVENHFPKYIADQLFDWVYKKHVVEPDKMQNISKDNRKN